MPGAARMSPVRDVSRAARHVDPSCQATTSSTSESAAGRDRAAAASLEAASRARSSPRRRRAAGSATALASAACSPVSARQSASSRSALATTAAAASAVSSFSSLDTLALSGPAYSSESFLAPRRHFPDGFVHPSLSWRVRPVIPSTLVPGSPSASPDMATSPLPDASTMSTTLGRPSDVVCSPMAAGSTPVSRTAMMTPRPSHSECSDTNCPACGAHATRSRGGLVGLPPALLGARVAAGRPRERARGVTGTEPGEVSPASRPWASARPRGTARAPRASP